VATLYLRFLKKRTSSIAPPNQQTVLSCRSVEWGKRKKKRQSPIAAGLSSDTNGESSPVPALHFAVEKGGKKECIS